MEEGPAPGSKRSAPAEGRASALGEPRRNHHPTVKPTALMRYLCRLITPPGGVVLDPFMGSGTVGLVAAELGRDWIGCDLNPDYCEMATNRIDPIMRQGNLFRDAGSECKNKAPNSQ